MRMLGILLLAGVTTAALGQTLVEYGLGAAAAGTAGAAGARGGGISGVFSNLSKTLNTTTDGAAKASTAAPAKGAAPKAKPAPTAQAAPAAQAAQTPAEPPKPAVVYEDPIGIKAGMERTELLSRFGEPAMKIMTGGASESLMYDTKESAVDVEMRAGKVYSVRAKSKAKQQSVVTVQ
jgi:hypothetical protein